MGRADQGQAQVRAGEELLEVFPGKALVRHDHGARPGTVRGLVFQHLLRFLALAGQLGVRQAEPVTVPSAVTISISFAPQ
jgi:hypothetical protein